MEHNVDICRDGSDENDYAYHAICSCEWRGHPFDNEQSAIDYSGEAHKKGEL